MFIVLKFLLFVFCWELFKASGAFKQRGHPQISFSSRNCSYFLQVHSLILKYHIQVNMVDRIEKCQRTTCRWGL